MELKQVKESIQHWTKIGRIEASSLTSSSGREYRFDPPLHYSFSTKEMKRKKKDEEEEEERREKLGKDRNRPNPSPRPSPSPLLRSNGRCGGRKSKERRKGCESDRRHGPV